MDIEKAKAEFTNYAEKSAMYSQIKKTGKFSGKLKTAEGKRRRR